MKTAISLPDDLFAAGEALSARLGVTRSQLYATALARFVAGHHDSGAQVTERLNALYGGPNGEPSGVDPVLAELQARTVAGQRVDPELGW